MNDNLSPGIRGVDSARENGVLSSCAVCGHREFQRWFATEFGSIGRCVACGQVLRTDRPSYRGMLHLHQGSALHETPYAKRSKIATRELSHERNFLNLLDKSKAQETRLLDIGCGTGDFLRLAAERGIDAYALEPIAELREMTQRELPNCRIEGNSIEQAQFPDAFFDAVAMWDVIEHLVDPDSALARVKKWLKPGGYLGIATINHDSLMYSIYHFIRATAPPLAESFGARLYNPFHTYYFTKSSLRRVTENAGFSVVIQRGYEFPLSRLEAGWILKAGMRGLYVLQALLGLQGEQFLFARKP